MDFRRLILKDGTAYLRVKGKAVDLGGIAKGYAVDRAFDLCRREGLEDFIVHLSGNLRVSGAPHRGESWKIGVRDPFDRSSTLGRIAMQSGTAVASSGSYELFVEIACRRYSHVIDPRSDYPVEGTAGVTVLAQNATTADGLSTSFFVRGRAGAKELLERCAPAEVLIVPDRYPPEIWLTPGLARIFEPVPNLSKSVRILHSGKPLCS